MSTRAHRALFGPIGPFLGHIHLLEPNTIYCDFVTPQLHAMLKKILHATSNFSMQNINFIDLFSKQESKQNEFDYKNYELNTI